MPSYCEVALPVPLDRLFKYNSYTILRQLSRLNSRTESALSPTLILVCHALLLRSRVACAAGPLVYLCGARGATATEGRTGHRSFSQGKTDWGGNRAERHGSG